MRILSIGSRISNLRNSISNKFTLPERFKGTIVERWTRYWQGVLTDYAGVAGDVLKGARAKPRRALIYTGAAYGVYQCAQHNPDEQVYLEQLRDSQAQMVLVSKELVNPVSANYLRFLEQAINHKKLHIFSLGIFSIVWVDLYSEDDCTYPAVCDYTKVGFWNFHERIIDVGFWNRFWHLQWKMRNYDVNYI